MSEKHASHRQNIFSKNKSGLSALDFTTVTNNRRIAVFLTEIFFSLGQDILCRDSSGNTIVSWHFFILLSVTSIYSLFLKDSSVQCGSEYFLVSVVQVSVASMSPVFRVPFGAASCLIFKCFIKSKLLFQYHKTCFQNTSMCFHYLVCVFPSKPLSSTKSNISQLPTNLRSFRDTANSIADR